MYSPSVQRPGLGCRRQWWVPSFVPLLIIAAACGSRGEIIAAVSREYQLKAVLLLNLTRFVQWPEEAFDSTNAPLVIGVLGRNEFGSLLEEVVRGEEVHGHRIQVEQFPSVNSVSNCHLLFVSASEQREMETILACLQDRPILTVSDADRFTQHGGLIRLFTKPNGKIGLRINAGGVKAANLNMSAMLLRVAEIVNVEDD